MEKGYQSFNHSKTRLRYHLIFSTKYRKKCLVGIEEKVKSVMFGISNRCSFKILSMGVDKDHIHFLIKSQPSICISQIVRRLKQISTRELWRDEEAHLSEFYWGRKHRLWTNGYFCSTVGEVCEANVKDYIETQG